MIDAAPLDAIEAATVRSANSLISDLARWNDTDFAVCARAVLSLPLNLLSFLETPQGIAAVSAIIAAWMGCDDAPAFEPTIH